MAVYIWRRRLATGATALALMMLAVTEWSLAYALELASADLTAKVFWSQVQYLGIVSVSVLWLCFALQYTGREKWLTRRNLALLAVIPVITLLLAWTNEAHGLIWSDVGLNTGGSLPMLDLSYGPWFWVHSAYSYLMLLLGAILLIQLLIRSPNLYRGQIGALLIGVFAPWVGNALYISGLSPFPFLDLTPFAFTIAGIAGAWALFHFRLLDIVPVARDTVVESMADGVIVLDTQARIVDINPAACRFTGCTAGDVVGQPADHVFADWPDLAEQYRDTRSAQAEIALGEGEARRYFSLRISALHNRRGKATGRLIVLHDATALKRAEMAQRESNRQLEAQNVELRKLTRAVEQSASTIVVTDLEGNIEYVNPAFSRITGYSRQEAIGQNPRVLKSGKHPPELYEEMWRTISGGRVWQGEMINKKKNGDFYWETATISPVTDEAGRISHYVAVKEDITARKRIEEALLESEERYRSVTQSAHDAIVSADSRGSIVSWNRGAQSIFGYRAEEVVGQPLSLLMPARYTNAHQEGLTRLHSGGISHLVGQTVELEGQRKDGDVFPLEMSLSSWQAGGETFFGAIIRDITARKQAQEALARAHDQALEASRLKTQLLGNVSHDMRTPLGVILGRVEMLQGGVYGSLSEQQHTALTGIMNSTEQALTFVNNLLGQAQIESGKVVFNIKAFAPAELLEIIQSTASALAQAKGLELTGTVTPDMPATLRGDPYWLRQVLANLVSNAVKFTEQGTVSVRIYPVDEDRWAMQVSDTGCGIPVEAQAYIFEPFRQVDGTATRQQHTGSGLGLSIVKELAILMGGEVKLSSEVEQGSTFTVLLPFEPEQEEKVS